MYRDIIGWRDAGLPLSTVSDEAAKMVDAVITQLTAWREDETGMERTVEKMLASDPSFALGKTLAHCLNLLGTGDSGRKTPSIVADLRNIKKEAEGKITEREDLHIDAAILLAEGKISGACKVYEVILSQYPTDMMAIKIVHICYFFLGNQMEMRASIERVMPHWTEHMPLYSYLYGMLAFGQCETHEYDAAEKSALKGLDLNRNDAWSTHAYAHVHEMRATPDKGIAFMSKTLDDWQPCGFLSCHNFWHWALYHVENGEYEAALDLFDSEVGERSHSGGMLDYVDGASLLYRLELEGVNVADRWKPLYSVTEKHLEDHILLFNDAHFTMNLLGLKDQEKINNFVDSINSVEDIAEIDNHRVTNDYGKKLIFAMKEYSEGNYDEASETLLGFHDRMLSMGGSDAQRDVFNLLLLNATIKSENFKEQAKNLLDCRAAVRRSSPMVNRLYGKLAM